MKAEQRRPHGLRHIPLLFDYCGSPGSINVSAPECLHPRPRGVLQDLDIPPRGISQAETGNETKSLAQMFWGFHSRFLILSKAKAPDVTARATAAPVRREKPFRRAVCCCSPALTSHVLTLCTVASLLLVAQYARFLLANEVTTQVPVHSPFPQTWVDRT